jgi:hypothetical protein
MSRSHKHSFHCHFIGGRNKLSRSFANRAFRRAVKTAISSRREVDNIDILPVLREVSNVYSFVTDGLGKIYPSLPKWVLYPDNPRYLPNATIARRIHKFMAK